MGIIADILWHEIKNHALVELDAFVVMPNHAHGILILNGSDISVIVETLHATSPHAGQTMQPVETIDSMKTIDSIETLHATSLQPPPPPRNVQMANISPKPNSLSTIIRSYKSAVTKHAHRLGFDFAWQSRFWDHIIRNDDKYSRIKTYIETTPEHLSDDRLNLVAKYKTVHY